MNGWVEYPNSALPHPSPLLSKERGQEGHGWGGDRSSSPLSKGGQRGVVQDAMPFPAQNIKNRWVESPNSALPHPNPLLGKEREQEGRWTISQPWEELLKYCTEGAE
jgi:hypothetical protein